MDHRTLHILGGVSVKHKETGKFYQNRFNVLYYIFILCISSMFLCEKCVFVIRQTYLKIEKYSLKLWVTSEYMFYVTTQSLIGTWFWISIANCYRFFWSHWFSIQFYIIFDISQIFIRNVRFCYVTILCYNNLSYVNIVIF